MPRRAMIGPARQARQDFDMTRPSTFLVFGATGGTGRHFLAQALADGHKVRALARSPGKLAPAENLDVRQGSITDGVDTDSLLEGVDFVVSMLGDKALQKNAKINTAFVRRLVPAMRRQGVKRFLYQAGGLSRPYGGHLPPLFWAIRHTLARGFIGQHRDNEAVMAYLATQAPDIDWIVHRAGIGSDGPSKGVLARSGRRFSVATHVDCAAYNYRTIKDPSAVHTSDLSYYTTSR
jgi:NAD(P)-dependent dehydrogenase (short-subunit alcohol dehydrogenase family)